MMKIFVILFFLGILGILKSYGQDFVYTPVNPAFGGSPYNYSWLLNSAEAQNTYQAPSDDSSTSAGSSSTTAIENFKNTLNRQILSQLSRQIVSMQFGEDALSEGTYIIGDYQIEIGDGTSGLNITIVDSTTGSTTTIEVPYF